MELKTIFEQTLEAKSDVLGYTNLEALGNLLPDYLPGYLQKLVRKGIKVRLLTPSTKEARYFVENFYPKNIRKNL